MKHALLALAAAAMMMAEERSTLPALAERGWFKASPLFPSTSEATTPDAGRLPRERSWISGPAFALDSVVAPVVSGRTWQPLSRMRFTLETATYVPVRYGMAQTRDTAVAARVEFRF